MEIRAKWSGEVANELFVRISAVKVIPSILVIISVSGEPGCHPRSVTHAVMRL